MKIKTREEVMNYISAKVMADDKFKKELINNPKLVLEREFNIGSLPEDVKVTVLEETPSQLYIVIPSKSIIKTPANIGSACRADTHWWHKEIEIDEGRPGELKDKLIR
jgi:hypothetical protein